MTAVPSSPAAPEAPAGRAARAVRVAALVLCLAVAAYTAVLLAEDPSLLRMAVWLVAAAVIHDAVVLPLLAGADRALLAVAPRAPVPVVNHVRAPALASGLTLLLFLPGIAESGEAHVFATGLGQEPYLERWLLLTATLFGVSALAYGARVARTRR